MTESSFLQSRLGHSPGAFVALSPEQRGGAVRSSIPDLNYFFDEGRPMDERSAPPRSRELARSLYDTLSKAFASDPSARTVRERIVTDDFLRSECDRDQNVYLGKLFTRTLTNAVPDLVFQPVNAAETATALGWAREHKVPVTLRGAASTAMGGAVPNDGGLVIDLSRLDGVEIDKADEVCVVGAGARLRSIHQKLASRGLALRVYPSNLGGTLAGWFLTGGIGMNAYGAGRALDHIRAADVLLPSGEHLRFHDDGRLDVPDEGGRRRTLSAEKAIEWFKLRNCQPLTLVDLAGSEGVFGAVLHLTVEIERRPEIGAFLLAFESRDAGFDAVSWIAEAGLPRPPANVKLVSGSHIHHTRRVWADEDARTWRKQPGDYSSDAHLPWTRIAGPAELGAACSADFAHAAAYLFVDFTDLAAARAFAAHLSACPGSPRVLDLESVRFARERFRPQQTKRLGPGLIAAEILMPTSEVRRFIPKAERLAKNAGNELDAEIYYLADGTALVIGGYLTDHRSGGFAVDLMIAPALVDLAMRSHHGRPYVLGRWQAAWTARKIGREGAERLRVLKHSLDAGEIVNRGVLIGMRLQGFLGRLLSATFAPGVSFLSMVYGSPLSLLVRAARPLLARFPGPAHGRGTPAGVGRTFRTTPAPYAVTVRPESTPPVDPAESPVLLAVAPSMVAAAGTIAATNGKVAGAATNPEDNALHCVNCGECNSVCPIFNESKIRLPQMLTHLGEAMRGGERIPETGTTLLDLCMRCGNCEQVCQAGIPHLPLYERLQQASNETRPYDRERHLAVVSAVRGSSHYTRDFLGIRPGGYQRRSPASLPGMPRYLVLRSENDAGPAASCIHCGACVAVCPTHANREFEGLDPRWITTVQDKCVGCGTCVEVCPNNHLNGGQTLRVVESPTPDWFIAIEEFMGQEP